ncbi:hypothetical protein FA95DRAFT_1578013 [Auriscalpium vulgare]|uniref:Uncharacterized protein n=1 Tax=Auriscalpium vulgare TaxID=40419 RepID=A0ACB8R568_9AGAM|nr:hypothetical protein FA95DRAFT_1578013 [Auriscalpium vulgare]
MASGNFSPPQFDQTDTPVLRSKVVTDRPANQTSQQMSIKPVDWHPPIHSAWAAVEEIVRKIPDHDDASPAPLVYGLPPVHAFSGETANSRIHHWLRLRPHCYSALFAQHGDVDIPILLTTGAWRTALDGHYYSFPIPKGTNVRSSVADIRKLAKPPNAPTVTGKRKEQSVSNPNKKTDAKKARRLAERIDIGVHFNIRYGVPPYSPNLQPWPKWCNKEVTRVQVERDRNLWAEVVWELSTIHFRMDLIWFDQDIMDEKHKAQARGDAAHELDLRLDRLSQFMQVWHLQGGVHVAPESAEVDWLVSTDWRTRRTGVARWSSLTRDWPGMELEPFSARHSVSEDVFLVYERNMYEKYCRLYHAHRGRLPVLPLTRPSTVSW